MIVITIIIIVIRVLFSVFLEGQARTFNVVSHQSNIIPKANSDIMNLSVIRLILMHSERWNAFEDNYDTIYGFK